MIPASHLDVDPFHSKNLPEGVLQDAAVDTEKVSVFRVPRDSVNGEGEAADQRSRGRCVVEPADRPAEKRHPRCGSITRETRRPA